MIFKTIIITLPILFSLCYQNNFVPNLFKSNEESFKRDIYNIDYMSNFDVNSNSLLQNKGLPHFSKFKPEEVKPAIEYLTKKLEEDFEVLEKKMKDENESSKLYNLAVEEIERIEYPLGFAWGIVGHLHSVKNNEELRKAHSEMQPVIIKTTNKLSQSKILYDSLVRLKKMGNLSDVQKRIVDSSVHAMSLNGIGLDGEDKKKFNDLVVELSKQSTKFSNNVLDSTKEFSMYIEDSEGMDKLPMSVLELYSMNAKDKYPESTPENGPWKITLDAPSFGPFLQHHPSSDLRKKVYMAYISRASSGNFNNIPVINDILKLKKTKAKMLGFGSFAELSLSKKMASDTKEVKDLLEMIYSKAKVHAVKELESLHSYVEKETGQKTLNLWDIGYWSERLKEKELDFKEEELKKYFPLESVLEGLFKVANNLFSIDIKEMDVTKEGVDVWDKNVKFFKIYENNKHISSFFLDPFARAGEKRGGAWMDSCIGKNKYLGHNPVAYLVCNGSPPTKDKDGNKKPSLLSFRDVETLFHEFGHGLQHMLTRVEDGGAAGINNIEWDAVELPSQFMENWCYHKPTVMSFARDFETGERMPDSLFNKIIKQRTYRNGGGTLRQIYFAMTDLYLYSELKENEEPIEAMRKMANKYLVKKIDDNDRFICSFSHIFAGGYSAGYYSYKWAEVMSADAFSAFEEIDMNNLVELKKVGMRFRETVLAKGGGTDPAKVFFEFRGHKPDPEALLRHNGIN